MGEKGRKEDEEEGERKRIEKGKKDVIGDSLSYTASFAGYMILESRIDAGRSEQASKGDELLDCVYHPFAIWSKASCDDDGKSNSKKDKRNFPRCPGKQICGERWGFSTCQFLPKSGYHTKYFTHFPEGLQE